MTQQVKFCLGSSIGFLGNLKACLGYIQGYAVKRKMSVIATVKKPSTVVKTK